MHTYFSVLANVTDVCRRATYTLTHALLRNFEPRLVMVIDRLYGFAGLLMGTVIDDGSIDDHKRSQDASDKSSRKSQSSRNFGLLIFPISISCLIMQDAEKLLFLISFSLDPGLFFGRSSVSITLLLDDEHLRSGDYGDFKSGTIQPPAAPQAGGDHWFQRRSDIDQLPEFQWRRQ
jgi:hypothetical protein